MNLTDASAIDRALSLLAVALDSQGAAAVELVVIGGAALNVLGIRIRPTRDVDVLALRNPEPVDGTSELIKSAPLPEPVVRAAAQVAEAMDLDRKWLNAGLADLLDHGLPDGFVDRLTARVYGPKLTVHFPDRSDLICLKVYAAADTGVGRHTEDLEALRPSCAELLAGARWARIQDPSDGFRSMLSAFLRYFGCDAEEGELNAET